MKKSNNKKLIVITANDFWRFVGIIFVVSGYFVDKEKSFVVSFGEANFQGELIAVLGLLLIVLPIFLRGRSNEQN